MTDAQDPNAQHAEGNEGHPIVGNLMSVPKFGTSVFNTMISPTEFVLVCSSLMPGIDASGAFTPGLRPECLLSLSPQAAKELSILLTDQVEQFEKEFGEMTTPFIKERTKG